MELGRLRIVPISEVIIVGERGRKDYQDLDELIASIHNIGLIVPIAVQSNDGEPPYRLLAGERRLVACQRLKFEKISVRIFDRVMNNYELLAVELFENLKRANLTHIEESLMIEQLNATMLRIKGKKIAKTPDASGHSQADLARSIGVSPAYVTQALTIAHAHHNIPQLKGPLENTKNKSEALNLIQRVGSAAQNKLLIRNVHRKIGRGASAPTGPSKEEILINSYRNEDFFEADLGDHRFSFIEVDPPYGINLANIKKDAHKSRIGGAYNEINDKELYKEFLFRTARRCFELSLENAYIICWYAPEYYPVVYDAFRSVGFDMCIVPALWKKGTHNGQSNSPSTRLGNSYESFLYGHRGTIHLRTPGRSNIFDFNAIFKSNKIHDTERPKELMSAIITTFAWAKSHVLVPFAGSGNTIIAAYENDMTAVGFDTSKEFYESYCGRILSK